LWPAIGYLGFMLTVLTLIFITSTPVFAEGTDEAEDAWDVNVPRGPTHTAQIQTDEGTWMSVSVHGQTVVFDLLGDLWSLPLEGGVATPLTTGAAWDSEPRFSPDGQRIAFVSDGGGNEQIWTMNADGSDAEQLTDEDDARVTDPVWDPDGPWILARRRTVDTRSIGVTELWQYHLDGGPGFALTSKDDHPHAGELHTDGSRVWFSSRSDRFSYDDDPLRGLWRVMRLDRETGDLRTEVGGNGSAVRPSLSPDGKGMVFVSRDRSKTLLEYLDFETRERRVLADWLDHDQLEGFALHGVYPAMDWTADGELVLWAGGKLWRLSLDGVRREIPFTASGTWTFHDVPRWPSEPPETVVARLNRWANINQRGDIAFSAMGRLIIQDSAGKVTDLGPGQSPRWTPDGEALLWTTWSDAAGTGKLHISGRRGRGRPTTLPITGQLLNPTLSADGRTLVLLRDPNTDNRPNLGSIPWYELVVLKKRGRGWVRTEVEAIVDTGVGFRAPRLHIHDGRIWWLAVGEAPDREPVKSDLVSVDTQGRDYRVHLTFPGAVEAAISPDFRRIAYKLDHQAWVTALPKLGTALSLEDLPKFKLTDVVGDWLGWSPDGRAVTWTAGASFQRYALEGEGIPATPEDDEPKTDVIDPKLSRTPLGYSRPRARPTSTLALTHALVLPMDGGDPIEDATVVIDGDRIASVEPQGAPPPGAKVMDMTGKTIVPGFIDVHAHMHYGAADIVPEQPWAYLVNLDFGVTTVHDPSASTDVVFTQAERVEAGLSRGPRVFSTGFVLYGALGNDNAETPDAEAAQRHVKRLALAGAKSVKVYQQSRRDQRQWFVSACNAQEVLCVAEGGGDLWMNLSMAADGFHAIEHALPNAPLYKDVRQFMAASRTESTWGTAYSPTLLVAYGGLSGELYFYQHDGAYDDARLLRHWDRRDLDAMTRRGRRFAPDDDWHHQSVAADAAAMARDGLLVTLGAHGQLQGLGVHWELWGLAGPGAMSPIEALKAATIDGARYLGMDDVLGSVSPGKLADLLVLDADPRDDIRNTIKIHRVIKNGEVVAD
jgi:imidazolonepropionase-like amidohydrolase